MTLVSLVRQADYSSDTLRVSLLRLLEPLGGMGAFVKPGDRVMLKPNLVMGFAPDRAATTHPAVVLEVGRLVREAGGIVSIGDSPGLGSAAGVAEKCGVAAAARELGAAIVEFTPAEVHVGKGTFRHLILAQELLDADVIINLPKLKTHCQMLMTMAVKNMFGAVVGARKFQWHYRASRDKLLFATMLYEICMSVRPHLNIVDAVVAMDGNGPTSGQPSQTGFLAAGTDPCGVDAVLMDAVGIAREKLFTLQAARAAGDREWEHAGVVGEEPAALRPERWNLAQTQSLGMHGPEFLKRIPWLDAWLRNQVTALPEVDPALCVGCGECVRICPARAMREEKGRGENRRSRIIIDRDACIRCYCCHELCPQHAIILRKRLFARWLGG